MPMTEAQRTRIRPLLPDLRARCEGLAAPERARAIRDTLQRVAATMTWEEWDTLLREEFGGIPAALARPAGTP